MDSGGRTLDGAPEPDRLPRDDGSAPDDASARAGTPAPGDASAPDDASARAGTPATGDASAPAGLAPSAWRLLLMVVPGLDARAGWWRRRRAMSDAEVQACGAILGRVPAAIEAWSEGNVRVTRSQVVVARDPVGRLARVGGGWWADPGALAPLLEPELDERGAWDSAIVLYPTDGSPELSPAWGYTWGEVGFLGGTGVSSIVSGDWRRWGSMPDGEHGFVHEWLHQVEAVYRRLGVGEEDLPSLHDVADRRTTRPDVPDRVETYVEFERRTGSWRPWYRDFMTGTVGPRSGESRRVRGLTRERWLRRPNP